MENSSPESGSYLAVPYSPRSKIGQIPDQLIHRYQSEEFTLSFPIRAEDSYYTSLPMIGDVDFDVKYYSCSEDDLKFLDDAFSNIELIYVWIRSGPFSKGEVWENEPDLIFTKFFDEDGEALNIIFVHRRVESYYTEIPFKNLLMTTKLANGALSPLWANQLPEHFFHLDDLSRSVEFWLDEQDFSMGREEEEEFDVMTISDQHRLIGKLRLRKLNEQAGKAE